MLWLLQYGCPKPKHVGEYILLFLRFICANIWLHVKNCISCTDFKDVSVAYYFMCLLHVFN